MSAAEQLAALVRVHELLDAHGIEYWLFGGWAVDFHAGAISRPHDDIDIAVWLRDKDQILAALEEQGWKHTPDTNEDGYTSCQLGTVRLELALLERDGDGLIYTPLREGRASWPDGAFETDVLDLLGVRATVISLRALSADKSETRDDPVVAAKDLADLITLSRIG